MARMLATVTTALAFCSNFGVLHVIATGSSSPLTDQQQSDGENGSSVCFTEEASRNIFINSTVTLKECYTSLGFNVSANFPQRDPGDTGPRDPKNLCLLGCFWEAQGLIKEGNFTVLEFAKSMILPESQAVFVSTFQKCLHDSNVTAAYSVNNEDGCMDMKHVKCISKASKACQGEDPGEDYRDQGSGFNLR